jgi:hypothetical protein
MRIARLLTVTVALVALTSAPAMADDLQAPADAQRSELQAEAEANNLSRERELDVAPSAAGPHGCNYYQFCTYAYKDYKVMFDRMSSCTWHFTPDYFQSYVNNQARGTRARFYGFFHEFLSYSKPAPDKGTTSLNTFYVRPC